MYILLSACVCEYMYIIYMKFVYNDSYLFVNLELETVMHGKVVPSSRKGSKKLFDIP